MITELACQSSLDHPFAFSNGDYAECSLGAGSTDRHYVYFCPAPPELPVDGVATISSNAGTTTIALHGEPPRQFSLTVNLVGSGIATVSGSQGFGCGRVPGSCSQLYFEGERVTLSTDGSISTFSSWGRDCTGCGTTPTCEVTMTRDLTCSVSFY
jgi:hypothetical protein